MVQERTPRRDREYMAGRTKNENDMPDVPEVDFVGALSEIWFGLNYAAYHLAYVRVYLQTAALQTDVDQLRKLEQALRDMTQVDVVICRAHLAAFFWQLDHVFEALKIAVTRGQKEHPTLKYFWSYEKRLEEIEQKAIRREISAYRNKGHEIPAIIGCAWEKKGGKFLHHFLPSIVGHSQNESIDMNARLQEYFEFVANVWLSFAPSDLKSQFRRSFTFPITIPNSYLGELPPELTGIPQLTVAVEAYDRADVNTETRNGAEQH
jgi:hypothetical protein